MKAKPIKRSELIATKKKDGYQVTFRVNGKACPMINCRLKSEADVKALLASKVTFA